MSEGLVGQIIKGKYRVDGVLGQGGMGIVVAAQHLALDQRVAIKMLLPAMLAHREIVERFGREGRAASKITSDHVARVLDVDTLEDGTPFMVMEYLEGRDLSYVRKQRRPLSVAQAATYLIEACEAIGEAHRLGIVHRDIKPANLFLADRGGGKTRVKVLDFGISKMGTPGDAEGITRTSAVIGSAEYMSPEQMLATREVDRRTDIWSLGVVLHELLTAQVPFPGQTLTQVCALVMSYPAPTPSSIRPDLPPAVNVVVAGCLEKDRDRRFSSVEELVAALSSLAEGATPSGPGRASFSASSPNLTAAMPPPSGRPEVLTLDNALLATDVGAASAPIHTTGGVARTNAGVRSRGGLFAAIAAGIGTVAIAIGALVFSLRGGDGAAPRPLAAAESADPYPVAAITNAATAVTTSPSVAAAPTPPSESSSAVPPAAASATPSTAPTTTASPRSPLTKPSQQQPRRGPMPAKANCDPPFTIDFQGSKHAKPECL